MVSSTSAQPTPQIKLSTLEFFDKTKHPEILWQLNFWLYDVGHILYVYNVKKWVVVLYQLKDEM